MKYRVAVFLFSLLFACACRNHHPVQNSAAAPPPAAQDSAATPQSFFPVSDYIGGQLRIIDSLQLPLSMSVTIRDKTSWLKATDRDLRNWSRYFREPDIGSPALQHLYKETSIADQSIPSVTLIYTAMSASLPVQKINVYIKPVPEQNSRVTGIYIEKSFTVMDTLVNQRLYWKTGKNLQVTTEKKINNASLPAEQVKIIWDATE